MRKNTKTYFELAEKERIAVKWGGKFVNLFVSNDPDEIYVSENWVRDFFKIPPKYRCNPFFLHFANIRSIFVPFFLLFKIYLKEWVGKEIRFPENVSCYVLGRDTLPNLCSVNFQKEFKILLYVNSTGCSSCRFEPGQTATISVEMKPDEAGHFSKTVEVYCNTNKSPILLTLTGTIE